MGEGHAAPAAGVLDAAVRGEPGAVPERHDHVARLEEDDVVVGRGARLPAEGLVEAARAAEVAYAERDQSNALSHAAQFAITKLGRVSRRRGVPSTGGIVSPQQLQQSKAEDFRALHEGEPFVIPNPWDAGSAKVLAALGFKALATTSAGFAFTLGRLDGDVTLDEVIEHTRVLDRATSLPVSVDLENGYGPEPEDAARAITRAAEAGAVGGSIEDYDPEGGIYELEHAVERVAAAVEAAARLGFPFTLTARAENHIRGNPDLDDTIARLQAYERAGADVLYAPGLRSGDEIRAVCDGDVEAASTCSRMQACR